MNLMTEDEAWVEEENEERRGAHEGVPAVPAVPPPARARRHSAGDGDGGPARRHSSDGAGKKEAKKQGPSGGGTSGSDAGSTMSRDHPKAKAKPSFTKSKTESSKPSHHPKAQASATSSAPVAANKLGRAKEERTERTPSPPKAAAVLLPSVPSADALSSLPGLDAKSVERVMLKLPYSNSPEHRKERDKLWRKLDNNGNGLF